MFLLSPQTKVFLAKAPTDMRKSFRSLITLTEAVLAQDPASGHLFVFVNGRRDMMKILHWDGSGFWIWYRMRECHYPRFFAFTKFDRIANNSRSWLVGAGNLAYV